MSQIATRESDPARCFPTAVFIFIIRVRVSGALMPVSDMEDKAARQEWKDILESTAAW